MADSVFTKILKGEIPCHKIYEDEKTFAFLNANPKTPGHTLVIPKSQIEYLWDLTEEDYVAVMNTVRKVGLRIKDVLNPKYVGLAVQGLGVPHAHVHVFQFDNIKEYNHIPVEDFSTPTGELAEMAKKLAF